MRGQFLRYVAFLHEFLHGVGRGRLPGAGMFEAAGVLLVQGLFSPGVKCKAKTYQRDDFHHGVKKKKTTSKCSGTTHSKMADLLLVQFFFFDLQLQHNGIELHVKVVGSLQLPLVVLPDVQRMPASNVGFFPFI